MVRPGSGDPCSRMPPSCLNVLKAASVMGMYFPAVVLAVVATGPISHFAGVVAALAGVLVARILPLVITAQWGHRTDFLRERALLRIE